MYLLPQQRTAFKDITADVACSLNTEFSQHIEISSQVFTALVTHDIQGHHSRRGMIFKN